MNQFGPEYPDFWDFDDDPIKETRSSKFWYFMFHYGFSLILCIVFIWGMVSLYNANEPKRKAASAKEKKMEQKPIVVYHGGIMTYTEHCDSVIWKNKNLNTWCDGILREIPSHRIKLIKYK